MAETSDPKSDSNNGRNGASVTLPNRSLTPATIMVVVVDTIHAVKSRRLLKIVGLWTGSTTTLINKRCLPKKCQPCQISQSRMHRYPYNGLKMNYHFMIHTPLRIRTMWLWQK
jgi:hypothetical protein